MVYYKDSASDGLKPIALVVSIITAIAFGAGYFVYSNSLHAEESKSPTPAVRPAVHSHV
jgi:hypothetical protein